MFIFTHSTLEQVYYAIFGNVMDYIFALLYTIAKNPNKCNVVVIVGLKILVDLFDVSGIY